MIFLEHPQTPGAERKHSVREERSLLTSFYFSGKSQFVFSLSNRTESRPVNEENPSMERTCPFFTFSFFFCFGAYIYNFVVAFSFTFSLLYFQPPLCWKNERKYMSSSHLKSFLATPKEFFCQFRDLGFCRDFL